MFDETGSDMAATGANLVASWILGSVCLANQCFLCLQAFFMAFFEISPNSEKARETRTRCRTWESDMKTGCKMMKNGSMQNCLSQIALSSPRWDSGRWPQEQVVMLEPSNDVDLLRTQPMYPLLQQYSTVQPHDSIYSSTAHHMPIVYFTRQYAKYAESICRRICKHLILIQVL